MSVAPQVRLLAPNSGVQFISRSFDAGQARLTRRFVERPAAVGSNEETVRVILDPAYDPRDPESDINIPYYRDSREYTVSQNDALAPFLNRWVPVPFIAHPAHNAEQSDLDPEFRYGPTNWARVRVVQDAGGTSYTAVFAFDTAVDRRPVVDESAQAQVFTTPLEMHLGAAWEFSFVSRYDLVSWFLHKPDANAEDGGGHDWGEWARKWVTQCLDDYRLARYRGRASRSGEDNGKHEALARYLTFLEVLQKAARPPKLRFIREDADTRPVDVELVLDIGNSRTHGILIERLPNQDTVDLATSYTLSIRDLQQPEILYKGAFESDVELFEAQFGEEHLSRLSGRASAFIWPSAVRLGPEAARIRQAQEGNEVFSGLSSPKRYLWDVRTRVQEWRFPQKQYKNDTPPLVARQLRNKLNARGDVLGDIPKNRGLYQRVNGRIDETRSRRMTYSRSSFYSFMMAEVVCQAIVQINCPDRREQRQQSALPRRLSRIILTLPSSTPVREQMLMKLRTDAAIELLWDQMGWVVEDPKTLRRDDRVPRPHIQVAWDEASCVQTVWLYGEIARKFGGRMGSFFALKGRERQQPLHDGKMGPIRPSLRVASVDVGGGTTDLMITTYYPEGDVALDPVQNFREGYRVAGDDILKAVLEGVVVESIARKLEWAGLAEPQHLLRRLLGADRADMTQQERHARRQFVNQVLRPVGLGLLQAYEQHEVDTPSRVEQRSIAAFLKPGAASDDAELPVHPRVLAYLLDPVREKGLPDFPLGAVEVPIDFDQLAGIVRRVLGGVFGSVAEALHCMDPDVVLLSGRPTRLPVVADMLMERLGVAPDRVVMMHQYTPGSWYPISGDAKAGRIGDPKTTSAVGGMLCALSERELTNFTLFTQRLQLKSTANYIGELKNDNFMPQDKVIFDAKDLENGSVQSKEFDFLAKMRLGSRQLPYDRWIASPLYLVRLEKPNSAFKPSLPIRVTIERELEPVDDEEQSSEDVLDSEARKEELKLTGAIGARGERIEVDREPAEDANRRDWASIQMRFQTLADEEGYWLDTGILEIS